MAELQSQLDSATTLVSSLAHEKEDLSKQQEFLNEKCSKLSKQLADAKASCLEMDGLKKEISVLKSYHREETTMYKRENRMLKERMSAGSLDARESLNKSASMHD